MAGGELRCPGSGQVLLRLPLKGAIRVAFDTRTEARHPCDLTVFFGSEKDGFKKGYFLGFGSENNTMAKLLRAGRMVAWNRDASARVTPGKNHHLIAQLHDGRVQLVADGQLILDLLDPQPLPVDRIGFYTFGSGSFAAIKIYANLSEKQGK